MKKVFSGFGIWVLKVVFSLLIIVGLLAIGWNKITEMIPALPSWEELKMEVVEVPAEVTVRENIGKAEAESMRITTEIPVTLTVNIVDYLDVKNSKTVQKYAESWRNEQIKKGDGWFKKKAKKLKNSAKAYLTKDTLKVTSIRSVCKNAEKSGTVLIGYDGTAPYTANAAAIVIGDSTVTVTLSVAFPEYQSQNLGTMNSEKSNRGSNWLGLVDRISDGRIDTAFTERAIVVADSLGQTNDVFLINCLALEDDLIRNFSALKVKYPSHRIEFVLQSQDTKFVYKSSMRGSVLQLSEDNKIYNQDYKE